MLYNNTTDHNKIHKSDLLEQNIKPIVRHDLSLEQQYYYKEITESLIGLNMPDRTIVEEKRKEALNSLKSDTGLHQILPRLISFFHEGVRSNILNYWRVLDFPSYGL